MLTTVFLHGLDSSGYGTKGRFFSERFPSMLRPDFDGTLVERLDRLNSIVSDRSNIVFVGSSFGGLMAACFTIDHPDQVKRLIMLAPALNFSEYRPPVTKVAVEALLVIGRHDVVTPPEKVIPAAEATFSNLEVRVVDDDHLLHHSFQAMDWKTLLN